MKSFLFVFLLWTFHMPLVFGQNSPTIDSVTIFPTNPTSIDSVYVIATVTTVHVGLSLGNQTTQNGNLITVEGCYWNGLLTASQTYVDTINLGVKNAGSYGLDFIAYQSNSSPNCTHSDTNSVQLSFQVDPVLSNEFYDNSKKLRCYPNPTSNQVTIAIEQINEVASIEITNNLGQIISTQVPNTTNTQISTSTLAEGVYFVNIINNDGAKLTKRFMIIR